MSSELSYEPVDLMDIPYSNISEVYDDRWANCVHSCLVSMSLYSKCVTCERNRLCDTLNTLSKASLVKSCSRKVWKALGVTKLANVLQTRRNSRYSFLSKGQASMIASKISVGKCVMWADMEGTEAQNVGQNVVMKRRRCIEKA